MLTRQKLRELRKAPGSNRLRIAIELVDVTQTQVGEAIGLAQSQVSEDANGKFSEMSLSKARAYADYFGCEIEDLFPAREAVAS